MQEAYLKQLIVNGEGKFTVCRIAAETEEALKVKRDIYLADDWQDSSKEEYEAQFGARTAPIEGAEDKALGGEGAAPTEEKTGDETDAAEAKEEGTVETQPGAEA